MLQLMKLRYKLETEGVDAVVEQLSSNNFSNEEKIELESAGLIVEGHPNLSLIYMLAKIAKAS